MKVYFLKENINEYIIFPTPESLEQYFELDIESEQELENKITSGTVKVGLSLKKSKQNF